MVKLRSQQILHSRRANSWRAWEKILPGLNAYHGDASACLLRDGVLVAAAELLKKFGYLATRRPDLGLVLERIRIR